MDMQFELGDVEPKGGGERLIIHISSDHSCYDSDVAKKLHRWSTFTEVFEAWNDEGQQLGEVKIIELEAGLRLAILIGQEYEWPHYVGDSAAITEGLAAIAKQVEAPVTVHISRFGGLHHPEGVWQTIATELERSFVACGVSVTVYDNYLRAIGDGDLDAVKSLVERGIDPSAPVTHTDYGQLPLIQAVRDPRISEHIVRYFVDSGVKWPDSLLEEALVAHRMYGKLDGLVDSLLDAGEERMLSADVLNYTAHIPYAKRLIELGASAVGAPGSTTPLHLAARFGKVPLMQLLIDHGASAAVKDGCGQTPIDYAQSRQNKRNVVFLKEQLGIPNRTKKETEAYLEGQLLEDARSAVATFGAEHQDEVFYGFVFDCNADEGGGVLFCFAPAAEADASEASAPAKDPKELCWQPGDWKYQGFEEREYYLDGTKPAKFLEIACRALVRMEQEDAFACVRRTFTFDTLVIDHDEQPSQARRRMNRVRKKVLGASAKSPRKAR
ncbi:MAG: ankyrin repeat domain-containing protein [Deltaproteobacteria bacterium]|nr:ankyrin repeat domain-containing protein [Deltaproteobacteria bacterium]